MNPSDDSPLRPPRRRAALLLGFALAAGSAACANSATAKSPPAPPPAGKKGQPPMNDNVTSQRARDAAARVVSAAPDRVKVELLADAKVPDAVPFRSHVRTDEGTRDAFRSGLVLADDVIVDRDRAVSAVLKAWHYDASRPVPARQVARVVGFLLSDFAATRALLEAADIDHMAAPLKRHLAVPKEVSDGGAPGVEFWIIADSDSDLGVPLYRVRVFAGSGGARIERQQIPDPE